MVFAAVCGTATPGLSAIAAPVLDRQGPIAAGIGLVAQSDTKLEVNAEVIAALKESCETASERLGFEPNVEFESY